MKKTIAIVFAILLGLISNAQDTIETKHNTLGLMISNWGNDYGVFYKREFNKNFIQFNAEYSTMMYGAWWPSSGSSNQTAPDNMHGFELVLSYGHYFKQGRIYSNYLSYGYDFKYTVGLDWLDGYIDYSDVTQSYSYTYDVRETIHFFKMSMGNQFDFSSFSVSINPTLQLGYVNKYFYNISYSDGRPSDESRRGIFFGRIGIDLSVGYNF